MPAAAPDVSSRQEARRLVRVAWLVVPGAQITKMEAVLALRRKTLELNRSLLNDGFISPTRIMQIEAETVDYAATLDQRASELARASQRIGDVDLRMQASRNFIEASTRTTLQYLMEPLTSTARKALRQM